MNYCENCGAKLPANVNFCPKCGAPVQKSTTVQSSNNDMSVRYEAENDQNNIGLDILSFLAPVVGWVLWIVWHKQYPKRARGVGISSLIIPCMVLIAIVGSLILGIFGALTD